MAVESRRTNYPDGGWCDQQYLNGKLHGLWTVYYPSGAKKWERQYENGRQEGYEREWDESGFLQQERLYHLDVPHGAWRRWSPTTGENIVNQFVLGKPTQALKAEPTKCNSDWRRLLPYWAFEPDAFRPLVDSLEKEFSKPASILRRDRTRSFSDELGASYFSYVNILGKDEKWPMFNGTPLTPILQIDCTNLSCLPSSHAKTRFLTLYSIYDDPPSALGNDLIIRSYALDEPVRHAQPPAECLLDEPSFLKVDPTVPSYPDANDLPPGLKCLLEDEFPNSCLLHNMQGDDNTKIGGWPNWIQQSTITEFSELILQVDSLDFENWACGDCAILYLFYNGNEWGWTQEGC